MSRKKTSRKWSNVTSFEEAVTHAKERGARAREIGDLTELKGPAGTILLTGKGDEIIPDGTKKTLWKWFKLAGLVLVAIYMLAPEMFNSWIARLLGA